MYCTGQRLLFSLFILLIGMTVSPLCAQQPQQVGVSWEHHDWGRFPDGSWQKIRVVTEQLSPDGDVIGTTTTEKLTQVVRSSRRAVTLRTTAKMEVAGKRFETPAHDFHEGNHGEPINDAVETKDLGETQLTVEGRQIPCRIRQYEFTDAEETKVVKIYYSDKVAPFVLKREEVSRAGNNTRQESMVNVTAFDKPYQVLAEILPASYVKEVHKNGKSTTETLAVYARDVPGGMVAYTSKEVDADGNIIRRSTAELIDYGFERSDDNRDFRFRRGIARGIVARALGREPSEDEKATRWEVSRAKLPKE